MAVVESNNVQVNNHVAPHQAIVIKGMEPKLYRGALSGSFEQISCLTNWKDRVTPTGNNVLHIHVGKPLSKAPYCQPYPRKVSVEFIKNTLIHKGKRLYKAACCQQPTPEKEINMDFVRNVLDDIAGYELLWKENNKGDTPLHLAATFGHADVVQEFLERAKRVNSEEVLRMLRMSNKKKDTALHQAARAGHADVVRLLVEADDPNSSHEPNEMNETPLYLAAEKGSTDSVAVILDTCNASAVVLHQNRPCGRTPLHASVQWGDPEMVQKILQHDSKLLNTQDNEGWTPIHCAAAELHNSHLLKELLDYDSRNRTSESSAVYIQDNNGRTALHIALLQGNWNAIEEIITYCPDCVEIMDNKGQTVVHYATKKGCTGRIRNYLKSGHFDSLLNEKDVDGNTPLHILAVSILKAPDCLCLYSLLSFIVRHPFVNLKAFNKRNLTFADIIASNDPSLSEEMYMCKEAPRGKRIYTFRDADVEKATSNSAENGAATLNTLKKAAEVRLVVAALIATVSFTSALTLPGGFIQDGDNVGMAVLAGNLVFAIFLVSDITAFIFSMIAIILYFLLSVERSTFQAVSRSNLAQSCITISLTALAIALTTGVCAVISNSMGLYFTVLALNSIVFFFCFNPLLILNVRYLVLRKTYGTPPPPDFMRSPDKRY